MDKATEERLLQLYEEVTTPDTDYGTSVESFNDDDDVRDPTFYAESSNSDSDNDHFREELIKEYLEIPSDVNDGRKLNVKTGPSDVNDGRKLVKTGPLHGGKRPKLECENREGRQDQGTMHFPASIPNPKHPGKSHHMRCRHCLNLGRRKETRFFCKTCVNRPPSCVEPCFENYHKN
ncbi:DDE Tnp 1-like zinc-ribbon [Popillia japonica]|uniref:DDE Tnp 1-like zinc-ribbon n=1 Tax=Popillia japonica TaxID=7064 RepID=A0AAW1ICS2_POPJA